MNREATGIDAQTNGVVDERERNNREQHRQHQQHQRDLGKVLIHRLDEVFLISYLAHLRQRLQLVGYPHQRIVVGIVGLQRQLKRREERVVAHELRRVAAKFLHAFLQGLFLADILHVVHVGPRPQLLLYLLRLVVGHVLIEQHGHNKILLHSRRQVMSHQASEHHQTQQDQYHRS